MSAIYFSTAQRRSALKFCYGNDKEWMRKVDNMKPKQVYAIFDKLKADGLINVDSKGNITFKTREEVEELKRRRQMVHGSNVHQITLDEFFGENFTTKQ